MDWKLVPPPAAKKLTTRSPVVPFRSAFYDLHWPATTGRLLWASVRVHT